MGLLQPEGKPADGPEYSMGSVVFIYRAKLLSENVVTPVNLTQVSLSRCYVCFGSAIFARCEDSESVCGE